MQGTAADDRKNAQVAQPIAHKVEQAAKVTSISLTRFFQKTLKNLFVSQTKGSYFMVIYKVMYIGMIQCPAYVYFLLWVSCDNITSQQVKPLWYAVAIWHSDTGQDWSLRIQIQTHPIKISWDTKISYFKYVNHKIFMKYQIDTFERSRKTQGLFLVRSSHMAL